MGEALRAHRGLVVALAAAVSVAVLLGAYFLLFRAGEAPTAEPPLPVRPSSEPVPEQTEPMPTRRVFGASNRDPFEPLAGEDSGSAAQNGSNEAQSGQGKGASSPQGGSGGQTRRVTEQPDRDQVDKPASKRSESPDDGSADAEPSEPGGTKQSATKDEPKGKAPVPVGRGSKDPADADGSDVTVISVREAIAIVRVNDARTTLYLGVPDASGVTYTSALGGGCGLFTTTGSEDLLTICKGETRQL